MINETGLDMRCCSVYVIEDNSDTPSYILAIWVNLADED